MIKVGATKVDLLDDFKEFLEDVVKVFSLPVAVQKGDTEQQFRAPNIHKMRLPNSGDATKKAPYILVQFLTGKDFQKHTQQSHSNAVVRLVFAVYGENEEEGALSLLNLMETVRLALMKKVLISHRFKIDTDAEVESLVYPDDTAPYYAGEMMCTVQMPPTEREVFYG